MAFRVPPKSRPLTLRPGVYLAEVAACEEKVSKQSKNPYLNVKFIAPDWNGEELGWDTIMLAGKGEKLGRGKLGALGLDLDDGAEHSAGELVGKRVYVALMVEVYNGTERLKVDIEADTSHCGYWPEDEEPSGVTRPAAPQSEPAAGEDDFVGEDGKPLF